MNILLSEPELGSGQGTRSLLLDGRWLFRTHGALRAHEATLALRVQLSAWPVHGRAGLLEGDIWRAGVLRLAVTPEGAVVASLGGETQELSSGPVPVGRWLWVVVTLSRSAQTWQLHVAEELAGGVDVAGRWAETVSAVWAGESGVDLDTLTIGGPRLAGASEPVRGRLAEVVVSGRAWTAVEVAKLVGGTMVGKTPDADALHWRLSGLTAVQPQRVYRVAAAPRVLQGREMRKDSVTGDGGSRGTDGAYVYRADMAQPEPLATITDEDFSALGIADPVAAMVSATPSWSWETALPAGNGEQGTLVLGRPLDEVIVLNRAGLFLPLHPPIAPPHQGAHLPELRALLAAGRFQAAGDRLMEFARTEGYAGEKRWTDPFIPAGFLRIDTAAAGPCTHYLRGVDYASGVVGVRWRDQAGWHLRQTLVSRADDVVVVRLSGEPGGVSCALSLATHDARAALAGDALPALVGEGWALADTEGLACGYRYARTWPGSLRECRVWARVLVRGGTRRVTPEGWQIQGADEVLVLLRSVLLRDGGVPADLRSALAALPTEFELLRARHVALHGAQWGRLRLHVGGTAADHRLTTEALFAQSRIGAMRPALLEKAVAACRYLALSSSGPLFPPTLQGIWGGTWEPSWSGDYTQNGNLQCALDGHLAGNLPEAMEGFFHYIESQMAEYRANARALFNARGVLIPSRTSSHGLLNHFDETWPMTFWQAGAAWQARFFYDYWQHTGDRAFLRERALPFMREVALFYEDALVAGDDGRLHFVPSYSPENDSPATGSQVCVDATMDHAAARELLTHLLVACRRENMYPESWAGWEEMLARLPEYRLNAEGGIAEWGDARLTDRHEHRHASHLYALYQGLPDHLAGDARLRAAFAQTIEAKMAPRRRAGGGVMAFGMVQLGAPAASLRLSETAYETVDWLTHSFWIPQSMVTTHNPRSVFNTDITGGLVRVVLLMLVDSQPGWLELLPALPAAWPSGQVEGVLCRGAITLVRLRWTPTTVEVVLRSRTTQLVDLRCRGLRTLARNGGAPLATEAGHAVIDLAGEETVALQLSREAGVV